MTQWGFVLLIAYVSLGASRLTWRKAGRVATVLTAVVLAAVFVSYGAVH